MFKKLRNKLLLINLLTISLVMCVAFTVIYVITYNNIYTENLEEIKKVPFNSLTAFKDPIVSEGNEELNEEERYYFERNASFNLVINTESNLIDKILSYLDYEEEVYDEILSETLNSDSKKGEVTYQDKVWLYEVYNSHSLESSDYYRITFLDITEDKEMLNSLLITLVLILLFLTIIIFSISLYFANKSIKPLEAMWKKQKQFVADATHELKTPLTIINANTDLVLLNNKEKVESQKKWLEYIKYETKGMNKLINDLLNSAKVEEEKFEIKKVNVTNLTEDLLLSFETLIYEKNIKLVKNINKNIYSNTSDEKLRQVMVILLDNAIKYTNEKGEIKVSLKEERKKIIFEIENTGTGITEEDLPHIFERFYKSDKARTNNNSNSYGLGLYIAKTIIGKLKGDISAESLNGRTKFKIKIKI